MHIKNPKVATDGRFGGVPAAMARYADVPQPMKRFAGAFPVGFRGPEDAMPYIYNHVNIFLDYHPVKAAQSTSRAGDASPDSNAGYRVVGFAVEPLSIRHEYADDKKSLKTCPGVKTHLSSEMIQSSQSIAVNDTVIYTYDVIWRESNVEWSSRWDVYLSEDHLVLAQAHLYSIFNCIMILVLVSATLVHWIRCDLNAYSGVSVFSEDDLEVSKGGSDSGGVSWSLLHADVFRSPSSHPMMYCVLCGSGVQLGVAILLVIILSALGLINPSRRGSFLTSCLIFYALGGFFAGYVSGRLLKAFGSSRWWSCTTMTALLVPGVSFSLFLFFNFILGFSQSSGRAPYVAVLSLLFLWWGVSVPLVVLGDRFGYTASAIRFPTDTSAIERQIPPSSSLSPIWAAAALLFSGILPFGGVYVELFYILASLWMGRYYCVFGFAFIVYVILLIICAKISMLLVYAQLRAENHRWWWHPFWCAGSTAVFTFSYCTVWFRTLEPLFNFVTYFLYFGYMFLICFYMFLVLGSVGALSSLWFVRRLFTKID
jgi:transmembrane 9 superfamily member 2/4